MVVEILIALASLVLGVVIGWLVARKLRGAEAAADESTDEPSIDEVIEAEIERLSLALSRRYGRPGLAPLFANKLRLAYVLRDAPREGKEPT